MANSSARTRLLPLPPAPDPGFCPHANSEQPVLTTFLHLDSCPPTQASFQSCRDATQSLCPQAAPPPEFFPSLPPLLKPESTSPVINSRKRFRPPAWPQVLPGPPTAFCAPRSPSGQRYTLKCQGLPIVAWGLGAQPLCSCFCSENLSVLTPHGLIHQGPKVWLPGMTTYMS